MRRRPIKPICTEIDPALAAGLARARGALYMERLQKAAIAACLAVREAIALRRVKRRRGTVPAGKESVPRFLIKKGNRRGEG